MGCGVEGGAKGVVGSRAEGWEGSGGVEGWGRYDRWAQFALRKSGQLQASYHRSN